MRVLVADKFEKSGIEGLRAGGCDVTYEPELTDQTLVDAIRTSGSEVLIVRSTKVTEAMLDAGHLALIVRAGAGYNTIDVAAASKRGIYVSNCPGKNAIAVAELAWGLILSLDRRIPDNVAELRAGRWNKKEYSNARGLHGATLGLLGAGNIATEMIKRAAAFGVRVVLWSRRFDGQDRALGSEEAADMGLGDEIRTATVTVAPTPVDVARRSDILSVHLALANETKKLVNKAVVDALKPGALVVNTSRAEVVDHAALAEAVKTKHLRVALDVYDGEPAGATGEFSMPLSSLPGVYGTHHIGASTNQAQEAIAAETVRIVLTYLKTGKVPNVVNLCKRTPATHMLVVRHRDRPGVLAHVFGHLRSGGINVQETENIVFEGAEAAVARINLDRQPDMPVLEAIRQGHEDVLDVKVVEL